MIWDLIQNEILGMRWLNELIGDLLGLVGVNVTDKLGGSIYFFIYDVIKITILLCTLIYIISYIQSYLQQHPPSFTQDKPSIKPLNPCNVSQFKE